MDPMAVATALHARDPSARAFGIELVAADLDGATVRMTVRPETCNGYDMVHGGVTFLLADTAMAFASGAGNRAALATGAQIDWLAPARVDQVLTATARRRWSGGRTSVWDIEVTADDGTTIALVRGRTREIGRAVVEAAGDDATGGQASR